MAIAVFSWERCLSCCSVSCRAFKPWLMSSGRVAFSNDSKFCSRYVFALWLRAPIEWA